MRTESTTEPSEETEDGVGETGGTGVAKEAENVWEGGERAEDRGTLGVRTLYRGFEARISSQETWSSHTPRKVLKNLWLGLSCSERSMEKF